MATDSSERFVLLNRLAEEFADRYRRGERPSLREYADRHPELADDIRELFPALAEVEQVKEDRRDLQGPPAGGPLPPLQRLGDYRIVREVGRGGMGVVYEAEQVSLGRHVALKVLSQRLPDTRAKGRFEREAKAAAKLHHTNIVPVFGVGEHDGLPYYVMQFIQGLGLDEVLIELKRFQSGGHVGNLPHKDVSAADAARSLMTGHFAPAATPDATVDHAPDGVADPNPPAAGRLSDTFSLSSSSAVLPGAGSGKGRATYWQSVARVGVQVADALEHAHRQGIQHRDVKPSNLLLDRQGTVWVTDFGLAKADDQQNLTHTGDVLGTLRYMPPEAFDGKADARGDVYSLGLTLYELLALRPAFDEPDRNKLIKQVTGAVPARLDKLNREVPRDLETIVHKAIDREPGRRYQTAAELAADLQRFLDDEPIQARRAGVPERCWRWCKRNPVVAGLTAAVFVLLAAVAAAASVGYVQTRLALNREASERGRAEKNLYHSLVRESQAIRRLRDTGYRREVWDRLKQALALETPDKDPAQLRQEAVACLGDFVGLEPTTWHDFPADITALAAHPDGEQLAVGLQDGTIVFRSLATGGPTARLDKHPTRVTTITFSPNGARLASASADGTVKVWRPKAGGGWEGMQTFKGQGASHTSLGFTRDSKQLAVCPDEATEVILWDLADGTVTGRFQEPKGEPLRGIALSPDGGLLAAAAGSGNLLVWDVARRERKHQAAMPLLFGSPQHVAFSGDGRLLVCNCVHGFVVLDTADYQRTFALRTQGTLSFGPAAALLAVADSLTGSVRLWNLANHRQEEMAVLRFSAGPLAVVFSGDGRKLAAAAPRAVRVWNLAGSGEKVVTAGHDAGVRAVAFSPDGKLLAACSNWDQTVLVWDPATGQRARTLALQERSMAVAFSTDGQLLAVASGLTVHFWDVASWQKLAEHRVAPESRGLYVAFSPDGKRFAAGGSIFGLTVWRLRREPAKAEAGPRLVLEPDAQVTKQDVVALCFSPDGGKLAWVEMHDHKVRLWDVANARPLPFPPVNPAGVIPSLTFHRDGHLVLVSPAQEAEVWDVVDGRRVYTFGGERLPAGGQTVRTKIALSADGRRLAWQGGGVTVWDMDSRKLLAALPEDDSKVWSLALSPDGERLAIGLSDGSLVIWNLPGIRAQLAGLGLDW